MKVAVGLSGGVDSSVAAALLKKEGHDVIGVCMKIWGGKGTPSQGGHGCYGPDEVEDIEMAKQIANALDIPFHVFDLSDKYEKIVLDYFSQEYISGRTPNPCLRCNPQMKFTALPDEALASGLKFDKFATGHYARVGYDNIRNRYILKKAKDQTKDQSYGLIFLSQEQLARTLLPLGEITKIEVRKIARDIGLKTHDAPDSQYFYSGDYDDLIDAQDTEGQILDGNGSVLGKHNGIWHFTIGQRKGLGIPSARPMYVKQLDEKNNTVIVGSKEDLFSDRLVAGNLNPIAIEDFSEQMNVGAKIRHTPKEAEAEITPIDNGKLEVKFKEPQWAITPGQAIAFYDDDIVLGGGIIE